MVINIVECLIVLNSMKIISLTIAFEYLTADRESIKWRMESWRLGVVSMLILVGKTLCLWAETCVYCRYCR